jgi:hypothetical protein
LDEKNPFEINSAPVGKGANLIYSHLKKKNKGIGISENHYYILHSEPLLTVMSRITEQVIEAIDLRSIGTPLGMVYDRQNECYIVYSKRGIAKLEISEEDRDIWMLHLEKG